MKCQNCGKNQVNVRYMQVINGKKTELNLCEDCANEMNLGMNFNFDFENEIEDFFDDFMEPAMFNIPSFIGGNSLMRSLHKLNSMPVLDNSYKNFPNDLDETLSKIQKKSALSFKKKNEKKQVSEVDKLKNELQECIKKEEYEKAAVLRDKIKKLEK